MEFFGITMFGPQNYLQDIRNENFREPKNNDEVKPIIEKVIKSSTCSKLITRPDVDTIRIIDCYLGRANGFAYGSSLRLKKMKIKGVISPLGPGDKYRVLPYSSAEYGWFLCDPALADKDWYKTSPRFPQPASPTTLVLDAAKRNNKYARLF